MQTAMKIKIMDSPFGEMKTTNHMGVPMVEGCTLAAMGGKQIIHWQQLEGTKKLIKGLESTILGIPYIVIEESVFTPGVGRTPQRIWLCEELAIDLAMWISVDFRIKCLAVLKSFFRGEMGPDAFRIPTKLELIVEKIREKGDSDTIDFWLRLYDQEMGRLHPVNEVPRIQEDEKPNFGETYSEFDQQVLGELERGFTLITPKKDRDQDELVVATRTIYGNLSQEVKKRIGTITDLDRTLRDLRHAVIEADGKRWQMERFNRRFFWQFKAVA